MKEKLTAWSLKVAECEHQLTAIDETQECGIVEKVLMNGRVAEHMTRERKEVRRAQRAANLIGTLRGTEEALETEAKSKARARAKPDIATIAESKDRSE